MLSRILRNVSSHVFVLFSQESDIESSQRTGIYFTIGLCWCGCVSYVGHLSDRSHLQDHGKGDRVHRKRLAIPLKLGLRGPSMNGGVSSANSTRDPRSQGTLWSPSTNNKEVSPKLNELQVFRSDRYWTFCGIACDLWWFMSGIAYNRWRGRPTTLVQGRLRRGESSVPAHPKKK